MKSKRALMGFAALLIIIFHLYVPMGTSAAELFIYRSGYIGVDLFFFLSGCSLGSRDNPDLAAYGGFLKNRLTGVYLPFAFYALIAALYKGWKPVRLLKVLCGAELFSRGGGAFLWFAPGIMLLYLAAPVFQWPKRRYGAKSVVLLLGGWCLLAAAMEIAGYKELSILINRIPVFVLGIYSGYVTGRLFRNESRMLVPLGAVLTAAGILIVNRWGLTVRLNKPVADAYYILAIPLTLGFACLFEALVRRCNAKLPVLSFIGSLTLELYAVQMIFGYDLEAALLRQFGKQFWVFPLTVILLTAMAWLLKKLTAAPAIIYKTVKEKQK